MQAQQEHMEELQQQVVSLHRLQSMVEGATQTSESLISLPSLATATMDTTDAPPTDAVIPVPPPPPPIGESYYIPDAPCINHIA